MRKWIIIIGGILNGICVTAVIICAVLLSSIRGTLLSQRVTEQWRGDSDLRFAQVSAFFRVDEPTTEEAINSMRAKVATSLTESSLEAEDGGRLFTDAFSAEGRVTLSRGKNQTTVAAYGIGGDFFLFHPLELLSGSYITSDDLMKDRVVLDESLAWRFFGSSDIAGMEITLDGRTFLIAGVVRPESDQYTQRVISGDPCVYVDYSVLAAGNSPSVDGPSVAPSGASAPGIFSYEIVLPNPITSYAVNLLRAGFPSDTVDIVENSSRYGSERISYLIENFGSRSAENTGILYPYWENAARLSEDYAALVTFIKNFFLALPLLTLAFLAVLGIRAIYIRRGIFWGKFGGIFSKGLDRHRVKKYERQQKA